jgi:hypothetical protein
MLRPPSRAHGQRARLEARRYSEVGRRAWIVDRLGEVGCGRGRARTFGPMHLAVGGGLVFARGDEAAMDGVDLHLGLIDGWAERLGVVSGFGQSLPQRLRTSVTSSPFVAETSDLSLAREKAIDLLKGLVQAVGGRAECRGWCAPWRGGSDQLDRRWRG